MRKKIKYILAFITIFTSLITISYADNNHAIPELRLGVHARALGMGGAFVGTSDDASAIYWNPAGMININKRAFSAMYSSNMSWDRSYNFLAYAEKFTFGTLGLGWINSGVPDINIRDNNDISQGNKDYGTNIINLAYSYNFKYVTVGLNGKAIFQNIVDEKYNGFGFDLGLYSQPHKYISLGLTIKDLYTKVKDSTVPYELRAGLAFKPLWGLTIGLDGVKARAEDTYFNLGAEYWANVYGDDYDDIALRMGVNDKKLTLGFGLRYKGFEFNYAYITEQDKALGENHRLSLDFIMGRSMPTKETKYNIFASKPDTVVIEKEKEVIKEKEVVKEVIKEVIKEVPAKAGVTDEQSRETGAMFTLGGDLVVEDVFFDNAKWELKPEGKKKLDSIAEYMKKNPSVVVQLRGFASFVGRAQFNAFLADKRAETVQKYLLDKGVKKEQIKMMPYSDETGRRVEIIRIK